MPKLKLSKNCLYLTSFMIMGLFLSACGQLETVAPLITQPIVAMPSLTAFPASPTSHITIPPTIELVITPQVEPSVFPTTQPCQTVIADPIAFQFDEEIRRAKKIFLGEIVKVEPFVWDSPDGEAPSDPCSLTYHSFLPVKILVRESFKGDLQPGIIITLLITDAPGALPLAHRHTPSIQLGEPQIWVLWIDYPYRPASTQNPLTYPIILSAFSKDSQGKWKDYKSSKGFTDTAELKELIKNPLPTRTPKK